MSAETKKTWKCQTCRSKIPKSGNINTLLRPRDPEPNQDDHDIQNIQNKCINASINSSNSDDQSFLGDTQTLTEPKLTLQSLSQVIYTKLEENNKHIISELKNVIQMEIHKAVTNLRNELKEDTSALYKENNNRRADIELLNSKMKDLERENKKLQKQIEDLETKITKEDSTAYTRTQNIPENKDKKIVIYGFAEYFKESDSELHSRVMDMFNEILHLNTMGYIEDISRVGRRNNRNRPLVVELISKRMVNYILQNCHYFQGTGVSVSEFLDAEERQTRAQMRKKMLLARKKGLHAIIRGNKLQIEGKIVDLNETTHSTTISINDGEELNLEQKFTPNQHRKNSFRN